MYMYVDQVEDCHVLDRDIEKEWCKSIDHMSRLNVDYRTIALRVEDLTRMGDNPFLVISLPNQENAHDYDRDNIVVEDDDKFSFDLCIDQGDCNSIMYRHRFVSMEGSQIDSFQVSIMFHVV